jgi:hypothetical protein
MQCEYSIANWKTIFPEAQNYLSAFCNRQHSPIWLPSGAGARGSWEGSADGTLLCLVVLHNGCFYVIHREELRGGGREEKKQWPGSSSSSKQRLLCDCLLESAQQKAKTYSPIKMPSAQQRVIVFQQDGGARSRLVPPGGKRPYV